MTDLFGRDCFKSLPESLLRRMEMRFVEELRAIGRINYESSQFSGDSQSDLLTLQMWRTAELKAVRAELALRNSMMPTTTISDAPVAITA